MTIKNAWGSEPLVVINNVLDSTRWRRVAGRNGDIVVATWAKTGTTWVQQILAQLLLGQEKPVALNRISPWIENRHVPLEPMCATLESQAHRRFMKTHLPATALEYRHDTKYIYIGRDGRDVVWSWYNHHSNLDKRFYETVRNTPGSIEAHMEPPSKDARDYFIEWLEKDGYPLWPFWSHVRSWWSLRARPNLMLLHFDDLKRDLASAVARIGNYLELEVAEGDANRIAARCTFSYMKEHASELLPEIEAIMEGGATTFINRGEGGSWRKLLDRQDIAVYEAKMLSELGSECAMWLSRPYSATA
jgi:aryl sulfotransferase